jgi:hypothetical protein
MSRLLAALTCSSIAIAVAALPAVALGAPAPTEPGYSYDFETDFVDGDELTGDGPRIVVRTGSARVLLIRPRTSFRAELLKTLETF